MKKNQFLALPLAALLALPAVAQQEMPQEPPSGSQTQATQPAAPASQSVNPNQQPAASQPQNLQSTQTQPQTATGREPLKVETREGFWGKINPFARKKFVQRQLQPVRDRLNELDELTAQNGRMIKDVDSRAQEGIRVANLKATEADQRAVEANNRATLAHQTATQASTRLQTVEQVVTNLDQYQAASEVEIRFRPGQATLSRRAKEALDEIAESVKDQKGYIIEVQGFSSGSGLAAVENSQRMAESVVRYLVVNHEIPVYRVFTVGMGNARVQDAEGKVRRTRGGRVEIRLLKNGIADLDQQAAMSAPPSSPIGSSMSGGVSGSVQSSEPAQPAQESQPAVSAQPEQPKQ